MFICDQCLRERCVPGSVFGSTFSDGPCEACDVVDVASTRASTSSRPRPLLQQPIQQTLTPHNLRFSLQPQVSDLAQRQRVVCG